MKKLLFALVLLSASQIKPLFDRWRYRDYDDYPTTVAYNSDVVPSYERAYYDRPVRRGYITGRPHYGHFWNRY
ncbi:MAG TPA: hypothetical protein VLG50_06950 [Candidatus Saccharimonadales bacterium]|nr:hypothetical protein [Candidatus Saccharimonadales bacterium]